MLPKVVGSQRITRLYSFGLEKCAPEASVYGACVLNHVSDMEKNLCKKEFEVFLKCVKKSVVPKPK